MHSRSISNPRGRHELICSASCQEAEGAGSSLPTRPSPFSSVAAPRASAVLDGDVGEAVGVLVGVLVARAVEGHGVAAGVGPDDADSSGVRNQCPGRSRPASRRCAESQAG